MGLLIAISMKGAPPPMGVDRRRSRQVGASVRGHGFSISRGNPLRAGEAAERPGHARCRIVECTVSAWAGALRAAGGREPSDRGFLTRSDRGPRRAGCWRTLDRMGDFSPRLPHSPILRRQGFVPCCREPDLDTQSVTQDHRRTLPARPPPKAAAVAVRAPSPCLQVQAVCGRFEGGEDKLGRESLER